MGGVYLHGTACPFLLYHGLLLLLLHGVCAFFPHFFGFISSLNSKNFFSFFIQRRWIASFLVCFIRSGALFTESSLHHQEKKKRTKKEVESDSPEGFFGMGSCLSFFYASALLFLSDANIGKWIKLEEYIHLDKAFFLLLFTYRSSRY